jgi:hypothetical protein
LSVGYFQWSPQPNSVRLSPNSTSAGRCAAYGCCAAASRRPGGRVEVCQAA